jgi:hypothetical protein
MEESELNILKAFELLQADDKLHYTSLGFHIHFLTSRDGAICKRGKVQQR